MTDAATANGAKPDTKLDARIFHLILKGQIKETSAIADNESNEAVLLADHPHLSKVLHLARVHRSLGILKNVAWWTSRNPEWSNTLTNRPIAQLLFDISREHATGFLTISDHERAKVIAFSAGLAVCIGSNLKREQLAEVMVSDGAIEPAAMDAARAHAESHKRDLEWALLDQGLCEVDDLLGYYELQAHHRLFDLFDWKSGEIGFHADERASQLENAVNMPLLVLLREGMWLRRPLEADRLRSLCAPIIEPEEPLRLLQSIGTLQFGLTESEAIVLAGAKDHAKAVDLLTDLERMGPDPLLEGLRFLYLFTHLGVIGVEGPEHAQPILEEVGEEPIPGALDLGSLALPLLTLPGDEETEPGKRKRRMTSSDALAGKSERRMTGSTQLKEYRLQLQLEAEGRRLLNGGQFAEAAAKFKQLVDRQERPVQGLAYLAVSALLTGTPEGRSNSLQYAKRAIELDKDSAVAHAAMARVLAASGNQDAEKHKKRALALSQYNDSWYLEVRGLIEVSGNKATKKNQRSPAAVALLFCLLLFAGFFAAVNIFGLGTREYFYSGRDPFFYIRRGSLLFFGLLGLMWFTRSGPLKVFKELGYRIDIKTAGLALAWGGFVGFFSPAQRVEGHLVAVYGLTLLHVIAEEVFFRGFVTRALMDQLEDWQRAVPVSAIIYGVYHLTYYSFWVETALEPRLYWCGVIGLFAGFPYALLYQRTKGITAPILCHGVINLTMMSFSLFGAAG